MNVVPNFIHVFNICPQNRLFKFSKIVRVCQKKIRMLKKGVHFFGKIFGYVVLSLPNNKARIGSPGSPLRHFYTKVPLFFYIEPALPTLVDLEKTF